MFFSAWCIEIVKKGVLQRFDTTTVFSHSDKIIKE